MRVKGKVQLSTYRMRSFQLQLAEEFLEHVKSLPLQYEKGIYFSFLEDYGTHYTKNGKSGGEYELIYVLNQDTIKAKSMCTPASVSFQNSNFDSQNSSHETSQVTMLIDILYDSHRSDREKDSRMRQIRHQGRLQWYVCD